MKKLKETEKHNIAHDKLSAIFFSISLFIYVVSQLIKPKIINIRAKVIEIR